MEKVRVYTHLVRVYGGVACLIIVSLLALVWPWLEFSGKGEGICTFGEGIWWGGLFENSVSPGQETGMEYGFWTKKWDPDLNPELDNILDLLTNVG